MNGHRLRCGPGLLALAGLCAVALPAGAAAPARGAGADPEGVQLNAEQGTYEIHRVPRRSLAAVLKSMEQWQHQVLADGSTADYRTGGGVLSMACSDCGLPAPSVIDLQRIDLQSVIAYEAGLWHIGIRSIDGTQSFFGVLRGEIGGQPDPVHGSEDRRIALIALADVYDLAYLSQRAGSQPSGGQPDTPASEPGRPAAPGPAAATAVRSLDDLRDAGDVESLLHFRGKASAAQLAAALEGAYIMRARSQMLAGQVDEALATLAAARRKLGRSVRLRELETDYVVVGDAYDRLRLAVRLDAGEVQSYLQQIRTLEPGDALAIDQMLAQVLANRIADQRAAGREAIAADLFTVGTQLFPGATGTLRQGRPGALGTAPVEAGATHPPR